MKEAREKKFQAAEDLMRCHVAWLARMWAEEHGVIRIKVAGTEEDGNRELEAVFPAYSTHPIIESGEEGGEQYGYLASSDDPKLGALQDLFEVYCLYDLFPGGTIWEKK